MIRSIQVISASFDCSRTATFKASDGSVRIVLGLMVATALVLSGSQLVGAINGRETTRESKKMPLILLKYDELQWRSADIPEGAEFARLVYADQHLVRWPPGAELPFNTRLSAFHGVVLSGTLVIRVADSSEHELDRFSIFRVQQETPHDVRCKGTNTCLFYLFGADPSWRDIVDDTLASDTTNSHGAWDFENLIGGEWRDIGESRRAPLNVFTRRGYWQSVLVNLNVFHPYRLSRGTGMPFSNRRVDSIGFVLSGKVVFRTPWGETLMVPGSFFQVPRSVAFSSLCEEESCVVLLRN